MHRNTSHQAIPPLAELSLEQKLGQLFMPRLPRVHARGLSDADAYVKRMEEWIEAGLVSGFFVHNGLTPDEIESYQKRSPIPLFTAADMESGATVYDKRQATPMPMQMALAAFATPDEAYEWAKIGALEARRGGINYVFGPVVDLALDYRSTCVGIRTLGDNLERVVELAAAVIKGYQDNGLLVAAKHYPGFGGSPFDAHIRMCRLDMPLETFMNREMAVYRKIRERVRLSGIMSGHVLVSSVDGKDCATTSKPLVDLLRATGFDGVLVTDSLAMKGLKTKVPSKYAHQQALIAGHDLILADYSLLPHLAMEWIKQAYEEGILSLERIDESVTRILRAKEKIFSIKPGAVDPARHAATSLAYSRKSITVRGDLPPLYPDRKYLIVISEETERAQVKGELQTNKADYASPVDYLKSRLPKSEVVRISEYPNSPAIEGLLNQSIAFEEVIFIAYNYPSSYKGIEHLTRPLVHLLHGLSEKIAVLVWFGNPVAAMDFPPLPALIFGYLGGYCEQAAFEVLTGARRASGRLPVLIPAPCKFHLCALGNDFSMAMPEATDRSCFRMSLTVA